MVRGQWLVIAGRLSHASVRLHRDVLCERGRGGRGRVGWWYGLVQGTGRLRLRLETDTCAIAEHAQESSSMTTLMPTSPKKSGIYPLIDRQLHSRPRRRKLGLSRSELFAAKAEKEEYIDQSHTMAKDGVKEEKSKDKKGKKKENKTKHVTGDKVEKVKKSKKVKKTEGSATEDGNGAIAFSLVASNATLDPTVSSLFANSVSLASFQPDA